MSEALRVLRADLTSDLVRGISRYRNEPLPSVNYLLHG